MTWLLKDFDLLSTLLRALTLALEGLTLGGLLFLLLIARPARLPVPLLRSSSRQVGLAALAFLLAQSAAVGLSTLTLVATSGMPLREAFSAGFFLAGAASIACALVLAILLRSAQPRALWLATLPAAGLLASAVSTSHAASRMENRSLLAALTAAHHLGMAGWVGGLVFLLLLLRQPVLEPRSAAPLARAYGRLALPSVLLLFSAGASLSYFYVGAWTALAGSSYGIMIIAKTWLLLTMLLLGASNHRLLRGAGDAAPPALLRVRRFSEAEIGLGLTAILAAASLTAQPPAIDLTGSDILSPHEIAARLSWHTPRLTSPPFAALAPPSTLEAALPAQQFSSGSVSDANDRAWSEYNHHWAGLIVLAAALLALLNRVLSRPASPAPRWRLACARITQAWPLLFLGLSVFVLLRADPENWPLGPRPFWPSFSRPRRARAPSLRPPHRPLRPLRVVRRAAPPPLSSSRLCLSSGLRRRRRRAPHPRPRAGQHAR